MRIYTCRLYM